MGDFWYPWSINIYAALLIFVWIRYIKKRR